MVASDTVVGLVGAGILLVALVGVFVYESQAQDEGSSLQNAKYSTKVDSAVAHQAGTGTQLPAGQCAPTPPATECQVARSTVDVTFTGLPMPGNLHYVVFLEGGGQSVAVGEATASGMSFKTGSKTVNGDHSTKDSIVLSLEPSASASAPTWKILTVGTRGGDAEARFIAGSGNHTLSFSAVGPNTAVEARLDDVENKTGYTYRGWMVKETDSGTNYTFVGNFSRDASAGGPGMDGTISGTVPGARMDFNRFIVTIEQESSGIGLRPAGPPVIRADYNPRESPVAQK